MLESLKNLHGRYEVFCMPLNKLWYIVAIIKQSSTLKPVLKC